MGPALIVWACGLSGMVRAGGGRVNREAQGAAGQAVPKKGGLVIPDLFSGRAAGGAPAFQAPVERVTVGPLQ
jgi:hypothetical protein